MKNEKLSKKMSVQEDQEEGEEFPLLSLPYCFQQRFHQLLPMQDAYQMSLSNRSTKSLVRSSCGSLGKLLISDLFKPDRNCIIRIGKDVDINELPCFGISVRLFSTQIFTCETLEKLSAWSKPIDFELSVKWISESALLRLLQTNLNKFVFRGACWFENGLLMLDEIFSRLSRINFVNVKLENIFSYIQYVEHRRRYILVTEKKFHHLEFECSGLDLYVRTKGTQRITY